MVNRLALALLMVLVAACSADRSTGSPPPTSPPAVVDRAGAARVTGAFLAAANAGDQAATAAVFAETARFDSVGRIYANRAEIMARFLVPEVLQAGGRYQQIETRWEGDRYVVTYEFTTRSGARERFTYAYLIRDGLIHDVIGRYL